MVYVQGWLGMEPGKTFSLVETLTFITTTICPAEGIEWNIKNLETICSYQDREAFFHLYVLIHFKGIRYSHKIQRNIV